MVEVEPSAPEVDGWGQRGSALAGTRAFPPLGREDGLMRLSVTMTADLESRLVTHLLRQDGQEDLTFATWRPSTGRERMTVILEKPLLPGTGDRQVHGNASLGPAYVLRAAQEAGEAGRGLAFMHSHPGGFGWQGLNETDRIAEARIANLARELTSLPLVGLTLAGDRSWSARVWYGMGRGVAPTWSESVRVIGDVFSIAFNDALVPVPRVSPTQIRTVHTWGEQIHATIARLRVAVAGTGSVGMIVADVER